MSPSASERRPGRDAHGFTILEVAVALCLCGLMVGTLVYFFKNFSRTFNAQEQITDRDLNAHYTMKRLSEVFMSVGANLPSQGWEIVTQPDGNPSSRVKLAVNPRGGIQFVTTPYSGTDLAVEDAKGFAKATAVLVAPVNPDKDIIKVPIDVGCNTGGFTNGVKPNGSGSLLRLTTAVSLLTGDAVYAYAEEDYKLEGTKLKLGTMVLAENIDSLSITFLTAAQQPTAQWSAMRSARVRLRARTSMPDPRLKADSGYRKIELSTDVLLRNRI